MGNGDSFIDRRESPKGKNVGDRQRFIRRARAEVKKAVNKAVQKRNVGAVGAKGDKEVKIPEKGIGEPRFMHSRKGGVRHRVLPGNKEFVPGDRVPKPKQNEGGGKEASDRGEGEDNFVFTLTREEFLDLFFEDLELPDLVKTSLKETKAVTYQRAGFARTGTPAKLDVMRTMRNSFGRRIALGRPSQANVSALTQMINEQRAAADLDERTPQALAALEEELDTLLRRQKFVGFVDPVDVRYRRHEPVPVPTTRAVMFCLMDVSGSMGEWEKDLAKRFFVLLHLFLRRRYERVEIVFIRHTHEAAEVDEETFFHSRKTGGTKVSSALAEMLRIIRERYPDDSWNIYAAQASDGENHSGDNEVCAQLIREEVMPLCQYFAYVEIVGVDEHDLLHNPGFGPALWRVYRRVGKDWANFALKRVARPADIYPVFRELFEKQNV